MDNFCHTKGNKIPNECSKEKEIKTNEKKNVKSERKKLVSEKREENFCWRMLEDNVDLRKWQRVCSVRYKRTGIHMNKIFISQCPYGIVFLFCLFDILNFFFRLSEIRFSWKKGVRRLKSSFQQQSNGSKQFCLFASIACSFLAKKGKIRWLRPQQRHFPLVEG